MRSSTITSSILLLTISALASSSSFSSSDCLVDNAADLAEFARCGHRGSLTYCLSQLSSPSPSPSDALTTCYINAGCSPAEAAIEASSTLSRCTEITHANDLRLRHRAALPRPAAATTAIPHFYNAIFPRAAAAGDSRSGDDCLSTSTVSTSSCPLVTSNKQISTLSCFPTVVSQSQCSPGLLCTLDPAGQNICMDKHDALDTGGIIVAAVLAAMVAVGLGALTFLCCKDRREQKRLTAKAEAASLKRAATRKERTPLMRQYGQGQQGQGQQDGPQGQNPFADQARS